MLSTSATTSNAAALGAGFLRSFPHSQKPKPVLNLATKDEYYANIDFDATDDALKQELHDLINPHTVISYDGVWDAFTDVDHYLPTFPCDSTTTQISYEATCICTVHVHIHVQCTCRRSTSILPSPRPNTLLQLATSHHNISH